MFIFCFCFFVCFIFSSEPILTFDDFILHKHDFFQVFPKNEWDSLDSLKQKKYFDDFLKKELVYYDALKNNLIFFPDVFLKIDERKKQLLVNNYYEKVVVAPFVDPLYVEQTKKNIENEVFVYHVLVGYKGCALSSPFLRSEKEAFDRAVKIKKELDVSFDGLPTEERVVFLKNSASLNSDDPSVDKNFGALGWVSWGRVVREFQDVAFGLKEGFVSDPVLTPYGYHLIFVEKKRPSDFFYYKKDLVSDLSFKFAIQALPFDSLKVFSQRHDSLLLEKGGLVFNDFFVDSFLTYLNREVEQKGLRGNKTTYMDVFLSFKEKGVVFVFKNKGFGLSWVVSKLGTLPPTRVPIIKGKKDFVDFVSSLLVQEEVLFLAEKSQIASSPSFVFDFLKNKKNIIHNEYLVYLNSFLSSVDSSLVLQRYDEGVYNKNKYMAPKKVVISELRTKNKNLIDSIFVDFSSGVGFDFLLEKHSSLGGIKKPISSGTKGVLGSTAFSLEVGDVSSVIENVDRSFSIIRVERFIDPVPLKLKNVYLQIERKIKKELQDSIKTNLLINLRKKHGVLVDYTVL